MVIFNLINEIQSLEKQNIFYLKVLTDKLYYLNI